MLSFAPRVAVALLRFLVLMQLAKITVAVLPLEIHDIFETMSLDLRQSYRQPGFSFLAADP